MRGRRILWMFWVWMLVMPGLAMPISSVAADLAFLSYESKDINAFNLAFKQYIAAFKSSKELDQEKGTKAIAKAIDEYSSLISRAEKQGAAASVLGRMNATRGLLIQVQGLIQQNRGEEGKELSIPIRTEMYELHRSLGMLTAEDAMIMFHNGLMHRAEPLLEAGRDVELEMLLPRIEQNLAMFKTPPKGVSNTEQYAQMYGVLLKKFAQYEEAIKQLNLYVDPEYGGFMLKMHARDAHNDLHSAFGKLYLSFPDGVGWKK